jgi:predicted RNA-binding Zn ribbon-like protein
MREARRPGEGLLLHHPDGQTFWYEPGALWLEFLVTGAEGAFSRFEILHEPSDLANWLPATRLAVGGDLEPGDIEITETEFAGAKRLRAALWRIAFHLTDGHDMEPGDLDAVNNAAAGQPVVPRIDRLGGGRRLATPVTGAQAIATIARDAVEMLSGPGATRVRRCSGQRCNLIFADTSRPGRRRWCSMERCGNRDKVRALRSRRRAQPAPGEGDTPSADLTR